MKGRHRRRTNPAGRSTPRKTRNAAEATVKSGTWQLQTARAHLSDVVTAAARAPQHITRNGKPVAVVLSPGEYDRLKGQPGTLVEFFQASPLAAAMAEGDISFERDRDPVRDLDL
ncbi:MAG: type II toxin-antitoxin system Phd/YefM family antitoxin [Pseudomonadota bacterium]